MSKVSEIRDVCGDYAIDIEYSKDFTFTMYFNSRRNATTVKRCVEVDDSVPNVATAVDFVEVVRCKDCKHCEIPTCPITGIEVYFCRYGIKPMEVNDNFYCGHGERKDGNENN